MGLFEGLGSGIWPEHPGFAQFVHMWPAPAGTKPMHYEIARNSKSCCVSGKPIEPGAIYYSVLIDTVTGLERRDYSPEHWDGPPEDSIGFWRGRVPVATDQVKPKPPRIENMLGLFQQLAAKHEQNRSSADSERLLYVLALLLLRKKRLKLHEIEQLDDQEIMAVSLVKGEDIFRIQDPNLTDKHIHEVESKLS